MQKHLSQSIIMNFLNVIHYFSKQIENRISQGDEAIEANISLPAKFTYPFQYIPHPLIRLASDEVQAYLSTRTDWTEELNHGKMFGVLLIQTSLGKIGYLTAFSGNLAGSNHHDFFVPPVFDLLRPGDFFKTEESNISAINLKINDLLASSVYHTLKESVNTKRKKIEGELSNARKALKEAKDKRDKERISIEHNFINNNEIYSDISSNTSINTSPISTVKGDTSHPKFIGEERAKRLQELIKESQFQKAEFKRLEKRLKEELQHQEEVLSQIEDQIAALKKERKLRSAALQMKLFQHFQMLNAEGEVKDLCQIFEETRHAIPPAGSGECALPKMLQYAYLHQLKPLAFGEFWVGQSPKDEIRHHGQFYPSCKGKCEPILQHMLIGLDVDSNPLSSRINENNNLKIIYEDQWIVAIEKPAGMLSTPGKEITDSVSERLHEMYPEASGPLLVHRLDMATSGILLAAKSKEMHAQIQALFEARKVRKIYTAIVEGIPSSKEGTITLPLCLNPMDRPRQMVSFEYGKEAITSYKVIESKNETALVQFDLKTGRTHQIRMHAAHPLGLNCPIKGDDLYGSHADRLYLHATKVSFIHPITGKMVSITSEVPFKLI